MRLRLTVRRNSLPAANVLWSVPETNSTQAYTITRLLEDVNHIIPLEAEHWGLEHYVVEVAGFECLHFTPVINALKEDDHVSIRPLMTAEIRARTLTGRHQISDGGQHLVDGIPFGRPYLRQPNRPAVRIPPRKRRRLDDEADDETEATGLLTENGEVNEEEEIMESLNSHSVSTSKSEEPRKPARCVQFKQPEIDGSDDSDEDDEDFAPRGDEEDEEEASGDSADNSDTSSCASETSGTESDTDSDGDSDSDDSDASSPPDILSSKDGKKPEATTIQSTKHTPPGEGLKTTRARNSRRTRVNRLRFLKASGQLPQDATLSDLRNYEEAQQGQTEEEPIHTQPFSKSLGKRKRLDEENSTEVVAEDNTELEQRKRVLMARLGGTWDTASVAVDSVQPPTTIIEPTEAPRAKSPKEEPPAKSQTSQRRLRPDTGAIGRILARQAAPAIRKARAKAVEEPAEPEGASDPEFWKTRINLSAFECWEEEFKLSTPPFPFQQHWDPASKRMRDKAAKKKQKKRGYVSEETIPMQPDEGEEVIILDYDDAPAVKPRPESNDVATENQLRHDVSTTTQANLPRLPEDMSTLPDLTSSDMKTGAIIVCKFFTVNPITITPEISDYKTATVEHGGVSGPGAGTIQLKIAAHDLPKREKRFDSKGNRIYNAADALLMEDDDEDEGLWEGQFGELLEAKLLKAV